MTLDDTRPTAAIAPVAAISLKPAASRRLALFDRRRTIMDSIEPRRNTLISMPMIFHYRPRAGAAAAAVSFDVGTP